MENVRKDIIDSEKNQTIDPEKNRRPQADWGDDPRDVERDREIYDFDFPDWIYRKYRRK